MRPNTNEKTTCMLCDFWWIILLVFVLILALILTRDFWLSQLGMGVSAPEPIPVPQATSITLPTIPPNPEPLSPTPSIEPTTSVTLISPTPTIDAPTAPEVGSFAPNFTLPDINGNPQELYGLRGQPVLLVFMGSNCPYCEQEAPHLATIHEQYSDQGLQIVVVGTDIIGVAEQIDTFVNEYGWEFIPLVDNQTVSTGYRVNGVPANYFIDRDGIIRYIGPGRMDAQHIASEIERIL